jgi:hypothetical protein
MSEPLDPFKELHRKTFIEGQEAQAHSVAAEAFKDRVEQTQEALRLASDAIDLANEIAQGGDPHKARLAALAKLHVTGATEHMLSGADPARGGRGAAQATPFPENSSASSEPSEKRLPGSATPKALPDESTEPPKRGPGRPRKDSKKG